MSAPRAFAFPPLKSATACGLAAMTSEIVCRSFSSSFTIFRPFSSTYFSGSTSSAKIFSKTFFATELLITPASVMSISRARCSGENVRSSGSISLSFSRRIVSAISQLAAFLGFPQIAVTASKRSAILLLSVMISASYWGMPNSFLYRSIFSVRNSGCLSFISAIHSSLITTGTRSGSGKYR